MYSLHRRDYIGVECGWLIILLWAPTYQWCRGTPSDYIYHLPYLSHTVDFVVRASRILPFGWSICIRRDRPLLGFGHNPSVLRHNALLVTNSPIFYTTLPTRTHTHTNNIVFPPYRTEKTTIVEQMKIIHQNDSEQNYSPIE